MGSTPNNAEFQDGLAEARPFYAVDTTTGKPTTLQGVEQAGYVALVSPPAQTNAGMETILTFSQLVNYVEIFNGTSANINYAFDTTVTAGSSVLPPGYQLDKAKKVTAVHILTAAATTINGATTGNIVVLGSL